MSIYKRAIKKWGINAQILMAIEETTELNFLLIKKLRENTDVDNWQIAEEVADVEIMLEQIKIIFDFHSEVDGIKNNKLARLGERLK